MALRWFRLRAFSFLFHFPGILLTFEGFFCVLCGHFIMILYLPGPRQKKEEERRSARITMEDVAYCYIFFLALFNVSILFVVSYFWCFCILPWPCHLERSPRQWVKDIQKIHTCIKTQRWLKDRYLYYTDLFSKLSMDIGYCSFLYANIRVSRVHHFGSSVN